MKFMRSLEGWTQSHRKPLSALDTPFETVYLRRFMKQKALEKIRLGGAKGEVKRGWAEARATVRGGRGGNRIHRRDHTYEIVEIVAFETRHLGN